MDCTEEFQAAPAELREKYDHASEEWFRVRSAIKSGAIRYIAPAFRVGGRRVYERNALDRELALRKFGDDVARARKHRDPPCTTLPAHLAPPVPQPGVLPFERAWVVGWAEHKALARLASPLCKQESAKPAASSGEWVWVYAFDDGEFRPLGGAQLNPRVKRTKGDGK